VAEDYELIDAGEGGRLERFGAHVVDRPAPGALDARRMPDRWREADLRFDRDGGWTGDGAAEAAAGWPVGIAGVSMHLRTTAAGQVGLFPEHAAMLPWLRDRVAERRPYGHEVTVLHLFAYTGLSTLALAAGGAAVTHVDASRPTVAWARENASRAGLADAPIRWIVDDAAAFVAREARRGRRYDGVVLDPPSYGHGGGTKAWSLERDLPPLLHGIGALLAPGAFVLLTAHTPAFDPDRLAGALEAAVHGRADAGELAIDASGGARLALGAFARIERAS
jgi:23S rRNA (cytosine1962-C5)-methyltransferase